MLPTMTLIRRTFPALRRTSPTAIVHTGSKQTVYGCLCGATHTASTQHRDAVHVQGWQIAHSACDVAIARQIADGVPLRMTTARNGARIGGTMPIIVPA